MTAFEEQPPVYHLKCDYIGCPSEFIPEGPSNGRTAHGARWEAREAGWNVQPFRGRGSRRGTDFCPKHAGGAS